MREREDYWFEPRIKKSFEGRNDAPLKTKESANERKEWMAAV